VSPRYEISVQTIFAASHQLRGYKAPLEPLHGHNFKVEVFASAAKLGEGGLVLDFLELEAKLKEVVAPYDHRHLNDVPPFVEVNPTTENLARFFYEELRKKLPEDVTLRLVRVWEAPTYSASWGEA
jgi:6-pyruvoyltetrahydropterin/6-carboxytetrahydropterin synthase